MCAVQEIVERASADDRVCIGGIRRRHTLMSIATWTCKHCGVEHADRDRPIQFCAACERARFASFEIQLCEHILEHMADGILDPLGVLTALKERPCYAKTPIAITTVASRIRILTRDTRKEARELVRGHSSRMMLDVINNGDAKDKLQALKNWGPEVNAEHVDHS